MPLGGGGHQVTEKERLDLSADTLTARDRLLVPRVEDAVVSREVPIEVRLEVPAEVPPAV